MIKAILSDFDGTLVDKQETFDPAVPNLISKLKEKNVSFSLATGRSYYGSVEKIVDQLGVQGPHVVHGGAVIYDSSKKKRLFYEPLSSNSSAKIAKYLGENKTVFALEKSNAVYYSQDINIPYYMRWSPIKKMTELTDYDDSIKILVMTSVNTIREEDANRHKKNMESMCHDISIVQFKIEDKYGFDITSEKATKHTAVLKFTELFNLRKEELVGIGDNYNDYPLFTACGYKIAMGNAPKELKDIADCVVPKTEDGGMKEALEHVLSLVTE